MISDVAHINFKIYEIKSLSDLFYYLIMFLSMPLLFTVFFLMPIYYAFRMKPLIFVLVLGLIFTIEYFCYTYLASQTNQMNGIYNALISVFLFVFFFYNQIKLMAKKSKSHRL